MKLSQWHFGLYLIPLAFLLPAEKAQAAFTPTCFIASKPATILSDITVAKGNAYTEANNSIKLEYYCTNNGTTAGNVNVCISADGGVGNAGQLDPRYMPLTTDPNTHLVYNMRFSTGFPNPGTIWANTGTRIFNTLHSMGTQISSTVPFRTTITSGGNPFFRINTSLETGALANDNALAPAGAYSSTINGTLTWGISPSCTGSGTVPFTFSVSAKVVDSCLINSTSDVDLGSVAAGVTNKTGSRDDAISVTCTKSTPYKIGLSPSNGSTTGLGSMSGTGDLIPYQLSSTASGGTPWGNNANSYGSLTNGVYHMGLGTPITDKVYVTVPNTDFTPGDYSDTVTVKVYY